MFKCKNGECPKGKDMCCFSCSEKETCDEVCDMDVETCGNGIDQDADENLQMMAFQDANVSILRTITDIISTKKRLEEEEKILKEKLKDAMEAKGIKSFKSDILNITYIAATTATSIDSAKLKKKYPQIAEECSKTSNKSAYVKIALKGDKEE